jgi:hypothetical protein
MKRLLIIVISLLLMNFAGPTDTRVHAEEAGPVDLSTFHNLKPSYTMPTVSGWSHPPRPGEMTFMMTGAIFCRDPSYLYSTTTYRYIDIPQYVDSVYDFRICKEITGDTPVDVAPYYGPIKRTDRLSDIVKVKFCGDAEYYFTLRDFIYKE